VTHDQVEAMTLADRMIVMNAGLADQIGTPLEVYANPATEFVAGFIGSPPTNFIPANLSPHSQAGAATLGIRPEHINLTGKDPKLSGHVLYTEALGAETLIHVQLPDGPLMTVRQPAGPDLPAEGDAVSLDWSDADQMAFDKAGRRC
jgi:sn-glycerol 3-phosphate transport system ATP-binding protein